MTYRLRNLATQYFVYKANLNQTASGHGAFGLYEFFTYESEFTTINKYLFNLYANF